MAGAPPGRGVRGAVPTALGPHYVHVFSHRCDMCVPLNIFREGSLFVDAINYIGRPDDSI